MTRQTPTVDLDAIVARMAATPGAVRSLTGALDDARARRRPASGAWSVLEIVNHMADEEAEDFRPRLRSTLEDPSRPWPPIDPEGAAHARAYNQRDLGESVERFARERAASVEWLRSLGSPGWSAGYAHPMLGPIRAGDLLVSWAAHDALHLRQIAKRLFEQAVADGGGFAPDYAGPW